MRLRIATIAVGIFLTSHLHQTGHCQDAAAPVAKPAAQDAGDVKAQFEAEFAAFNKMRDSLGALRKKVEAAPENERKALVSEYMKAIEPIRESLKKLQVAAEAAFKAAPNESDSVVTVLIGLAQEQILEDHFEPALATLKLLRDNQCEKKEINCLWGVAAYCLDDFATAEKELTEANKAGKISVHRMASGFLADCQEAQKALAEEMKLREAEAKAGDLPRVKLETSKGVIVLELFENEAPDTVGNFVSLVEKKFYDGLTFHRVLGNFMAQGGCPHGTGEGGPGYNIYCECVKPEHRKHFRGSLSMAKETAPNTGGSQFFLTFRRTAHLDGKHTVFGRVVEGLDVLEKIQRRNPGDDEAVKTDVIVKAEVLRKREHAYAPKKAPE